jgi:hypothetical protein
MELIGGFNPYLLYSSLLGEYRVFILSLSLVFCEYALSLI